MDYENFKEQFVEDVKEKLYEQGTEVDITVNTVNKLNESYEAMTVKPEGSNIGVNIGIDKFYGATQDGITLCKAAKEAFSKIEGKLPKIKELNQEYSEVLQEKKKTYAEYRQAKQDMKDIQMAKYNVDLFLKFEEQK